MFLIRPLVSELRRPKDFLLQAAAHVESPRTADKSVIYGTIRRGKF